MQVSGLHPAGKPLSVKPALTNPATEMLPSHPITSPDRVLFAANSQKSKYTPEELELITEDLSSLYTSNRINALLKLQKLDKIPDNKLARSAARYLYFNDALSPEHRKTARWIAIELLERNKSPWAADALTTNAQEISDKDLAKYSIASLSRIYPTMPRRIQNRARLELLNYYLGSSTFRNSRVEELITFMKRYADKEDSNLLWYLMSESGLKNGMVTPTLMKIFTHGMGRAYGPDYFNLLLDDYRNVRLNGTSGSGFGPAEADFLKISLREFPQLVLSQSPEELKKSGPENIEKTAYALVEALSYLRKETPDLGTDDRNNYGEAICALAPLLSTDERRLLTIHMADKIEESPKNIELLASLIVILQAGTVTYEDVMKGFIDPKFGRYSEQTTPLFPRLIPWPDNGIPEAQLIRLKAVTEPSRWPKKDLISKTGNLLKSFFRFLDPEPVQNRDSTRDLFANKQAAIQTASQQQPVRPKKGAQNAPGFDLTPAPLSRPSELPNMKAETYEKLEEHQSKLAEGIAEGDSEKIQLYTECLMDHWIANQSQIALSFLTERFDNPVVVSKFLNNMAKLQAKLKNSPPTPAFIQTSSVTGTSVTKPLRIPPDQLMSALEQIPPDGFAPNDLDIKHLRETVLPMVTRHPEQRNNALKLMLDLHKNMTWPAPRLGRANPDSPKQDMAFIIFNLMKSGTPPWVLRDYRDTLNTALTDASNVFAQKPVRDIYFNQPHIDWTNLLEGSLDETNLIGQSGMEQSLKHDMDLLVHLAAKTGNTQATDRVVERLFTQYNNIRGTQYVDKSYLINFLRKPELTETVLKSNNDQTFQRYVEMVGWFKVFEAVPRLIEYGAEEAPLEKKVAIQSAIATMIDYYAMPELRELKANGSTRKIREFARDTLREMSKPKYVSTLHQPMVDIMPKQFRQRLNALEKGRGIVTAQPEVDNKQRTSIEDLTSRRRVVIKDAERYIDTPEPSGEQNSTASINPVQRPDANQTSENLLRATRRKVRILGVDSLEDIDNLEEARGSFISQMRDAFAMLQLTNNSNLKLQASDQLIALSKQFKALGQSKNGNIKFITPEKTAFVREVGERLNQTRDIAEQAVLNMLLTDLQDAAAVPYLLSFIRETTRRQEEGVPAINASLPLQTLRDIGATQSTEEVRALLDTLPENLHRSVLDVLASAGDTEGLIQAYTQRTYPADTTAWLAKTLAEKVSGMPELEDQVKPKIVEGLRQTEGNSQAQLDFIGALYSLVDDGDADIARLLTELASTDEAGRDLKKAVLGVLEFIERTPEMTRFFNKIKQEDDPELRRMAQTLLSNS